MGNVAIFTAEIAERLIARGFKLYGYTDKAWFFEDSLRLERAVSELVKALEGEDK